MDFLSYVKLSEWFWNVHKKPFSFLRTQTSAITLSFFFWRVFPLDVDITCEIRSAPVGRIRCEICNADTSLHLAWHGAALNINSLQLAIYHQLFSRAASNLSPHSVIFFFSFCFMVWLLRVDVGAQMEVICSVWRAVLYLSRRPVKRLRL